MRKILSIAAIVLVVVAVVILNIDSYDYEKAYRKTEKLKSFEIAMSTIVDISEGDDHRQSVIEQVFSVENFGKKNMKYKVASNSYSVDIAGKIVEEVSEYTYYDEEYYLSFPGVKYKSFCGFDVAKSNIESLIHAVSFPYDKMYNIEKYKDAGEMHYEFDVEHSDVSNHVITALQAAINNFEGTNFHVADVSAEAVVKNNYVVERNLWVVYESDSGVEIALDVRCNLIKKNCKVEVPDASKYASL